MTPGIGLFKRLEDITPDDIDYLVAEGVEESQDLEFKSQNYGNSDSERRERLRDVASVANGGGGYLILGVDESENRACQISGLQDAVAAGDSLRSACLSGIEPRLNGLDCRSIQAGKGQTILAVFVPPCGDKVHAVTYSGTVEYWKRYGRFKNRMRPDEIRQAFLQGQDRYDSSLKLLSSSVSSFITAHYDHPRMLVAAVPVGFHSERLDPLYLEVKRILQEPPYHRDGGATLLSLGFSRVTACLYGAHIEDTDGAVSNPANHVEIHRNGYVAVDFKVFAIQDRSDTQPYFQGWWIAEFPLAALSTIGEIYRVSGVSDAILVDVALAGLSGYKLKREASGYVSPDLFVSPPKAAFSIGPFEAPPGQDPRTLAGKIAHRMWNAFGYVRSPWVNENGEVFIQ